MTKYVLLTFTVSWWILLQKLVQKLVLSYPCNLDEDKVCFNALISSLQLPPKLYSHTLQRRKHISTVCHQRFHKRKLLALVIIVWKTDTNRKMCLGPPFSHITVTQAFYTISTLKVGSCLYLQN